MKECCKDFHKKTLKELASGRAALKYMPKLLGLLHHLQGSLPPGHFTATAPF